MSTATMTLAAEIADLTPRQLQVLDLVAKGKTDSSIARSLGIGIRTVYTYLGQIRTALGADSRAHAVALAYQVRILPLP